MSLPRPKHRYKAIFEPDHQGIKGPDEDGRGFGYTLALHKTRSDSSPYCLVNEYVASTIGQFLRLPIPPFSITYGEHGGVFFSTLDFNFDREQLPAIFPDLCWQYLPSICTGILLFDILIANSDRHVENLVVDNQRTPTQLRVFDHNQALLGGGNPSLCGVDLLEKLELTRLGITGGHVTKGCRHCLLDVVDTRQYFDEWIDRIDSLPRWFIRDVCQSARGLGVEHDILNRIADFLISRRNNFDGLIRQNLNEFSGLAERQNNDST